MRFLTFVLIAFVFSSVASADLVLNIDTSTEEFYFTGSTTGVGDNSGLAQWRTNGTQSGAQSFAFMSGAIIVSGANITAGNSGIVMKGPNGVGDIQIDTDSSNSAFTLTGAGEAVRVSYGGFTEANKASFESLIGSSISLNRGSGFGGVSAVNGAAAVPEPSSFVCLGLIGSALMLRRRRDISL